MANERKEEMLREIQKLSEKYDGWQCEGYEISNDYIFNKSIIKALYLGGVEESIEKILNDLRNFKQANKYDNFNQAFHDWEGRGLFRITPCYTVNDDGVPCLLLGIREWLRLCKRYGWMASYNDIGNRPRYTYVYNIDKLLFEISQEVRECELEVDIKGDVLTASLVAILHRKYTTGQSMLYWMKDDISKFLTKSLRSDNTVLVNSFLDRISVSKFHSCLSLEEISTKNDMFISIEYDKRRHCILILSKEYVQLLRKTREEYIVTKLSLPRWLWCTCKYEEDDVECFVVSSELRVKLVNVFVNSLMTYCDWTCDYTMWYTDYFEDFYGMSFDIKERASNLKELEALIANYYGENLTERLRGTCTDPIIFKGKGSGESPSNSMISAAQKSSVEN